MSLPLPIALSPPNSALNVPYITKTVGIGDMNVRGLTHLSDNKSAIFGQFNSINSKSRNFLAKLDSKYYAESGFNTHIPADIQNTIVYELIEYGGSYIITGVMNSVAGASVKNIARIRSDGSSASFTFPDITPSGGATALWSSSYVADRLYIAGGSVGSLAPLTVRTRMLALNMTSPTSATIDSAFNLGATISGNIYGILDDPYTSNRLMIYGAIAVSGSPIRAGICRINASTGAHDATFLSALPTTATVFDAHINSSNGSLLVGGYFESPVAINRNLRRLSNTGADTGASNFAAYDADNFPNIAQVSALCNVPSGSFTDYILIGGTTGHVYMMDSSGAKYAGFASAGYLSVTGGQVYSIDYISDDNIVICGAFTSVAGQSRTGFAVIDIAGNLL